MQPDTDLLRKIAADIHTIRNVVLVFFWLAIISFVLGVAAVGVDALGQSAEDKLDDVGNQIGGSDSAYDRCVAAGLSRASCENIYG